MALALCLVRRWVYARGDVQALSVLPSSCARDPQSLANLGPGARAQVRSGYNFERVTEEVKSALLAIEEGAF